MMRHSPLAAKSFRTALVRCFSAAAVPAMASCFILSTPQYSTLPFQAGRQIAPMPSLVSAPRIRSRLMMSSPPEAGGDTVVAGMEKKLKNELSPVQLEVIPAYGDPNGSHVTIKVVSDVFEGKRALQRQQMVYKIIWEEMQGAIHAVDEMVCKTPSEAGL
mmetsp:Transcript_34265/g.68529  ORF Transcript_34265/g.68529 Transcript_34265/m.68529 type:complete len:160 (+) Transcript_34265:24-503(+)